MPAQVNSYSLWLAAQQNPICSGPGPTGPSGLPGSNGSTGATGPTGPAGINGISVGQNYFFNLSDNIITNTGPTGGNLDVYSYNAGQNTAYTGSDYFGYFIQQRGTGPTGVNIARFISEAGLQNPIPSGVWTFYNNIYSFTGPTGTIGTWAIPPTPGTTNEVYAQVSYVDGPTGGKIFQTAPKNINLSDDLVILNGYIENPITLINPAGAYFYVDYFATNPTSGNVIEFWTQGNSVAYVTTTFSPQQGSQGATGATGATGPQGPQGPAGTTLGSANRLAWFPTNNNVTSTPGITTDGNNLTVAQTLTATNTLPGAPAGVSIVQTDRTTPSSAATLELSGGLGGGGAAGGSVYKFYKGCGPLGTGVINQDHLQLIRFGPTGAVAPILSGVLDIAPKMVADSSSSAENLMSVFADLNVGGTLAVGGALTSGLGSFGATNPPFDTSAAVGYNTMAIAGFRFIWGRVISNGVGPNPGLFAATFPSSLVSLNVDGSIKGCVSLATVVASDTESAYTCHFTNGGRVSGTTSIIDGICESAQLPAPAVSVVYLVIATAA